MNDFDNTIDFLELEHDALSIVVQEVLSDLYLKGHLNPYKDLVDNPTITNTEYLDYLDMYVIDVELPIQPDSDIDVYNYNTLTMTIEFSNVSAKHDSDYFARMMFNDCNNKPVNYESR